VPAETFLAAKPPLGKPFSTVLLCSQDGVPTVWCATFVDLYRAEPPLFGRCSTPGAFV
jgi:hypothetical protein